MTAREAMVAARGFGWSVERLRFGYAARFGMADRPFFHRTSSAKVWAVVFAALGVRVEG